MKTKVKNYNSRTEKDYNFWRSLYYQLFVVLVVMPVSKLMYNIKVEGRENVPKGSRLIFAGNHVSYLDPPMLTYAVHRRIAYMAKKELFESDNKLLKFLVHSLGGFAVNREKPELATFKTVKAVFNTPWSLGIFPQGKIVKEPVIKNITKGFILFAKKFEADIVPVGICGFDGYAKKLFEKHMTLKIGTPISYKLDDDEIIKEWARQICEFTGFENQIEINSSEIPVNIS
ncbi:1-acyl-sn-glycerol-3-phosphate acyltransferase [bacterium]|nr:1-acyl-sn-glycerol-3-phosphate acyltransferase [bacterium]